MPPPDVLASGSERRPRRLPRRAVGLVLAVAAAVPVVRARTAEPPLALHLEERPGVYLGVSADLGRPVHLDVPVRVVNDGERAVRVRRAGVRGGVLRTEGPLDVRVPAGSSAQVLLEQDVLCRPDGAPAALGPRARLRLDLVGRRRVLLPLSAEPFGTIDREVQLLCGYVPVEQAVLAEPRPARLAGDVLRVPLALTNTSAEPARLVGVEVAAAVTAVRLVAPAVPVPLGVAPGPRPRPPSLAYPRVPVALEVRLGAGRCPGVGAGVGTTPGLLAVLRVDRGPGTRVASVYLPDTGHALPLLLRRCARG